MEEEEEEEEDCGAGSDPHHSDCQRFPETGGEEEREMKREIEGERGRREAGEEEDKTGGWGSFMNGAR